ncbi:MAG: hypothetical protein MZV70_57550 [Desulfobacterales bacterium]|nr:hypothetical protein [Desulfobacterales bacterium]
MMTFEAALQQNFTINPNQSIFVEVSRRKMGGNYQTEVKALWNLFF